ncbi:hypothetical protein HYPSUDRAFT_40598 [Hypholoma sublateritium FD-334 SS-4]|uniref:FAD-binding domain-containing protein n=1 Tax=Hypholoma sublateritium (strain FD-334 SS-4) TaxID=945553 RepID=A0A0D2MGQ4_HYPSF|nr:hypothetical protein HYPSUDRAFT_40598 [Hypholoma sublateritium FD-334 SS-4]
MPSSSHVDPIAIVGGGPGGLLLARYLQLHNLTCVVYEGEGSSANRNQGGTLDLHEETGLQALRETSLLENAQKKMRSGPAEAMKTMDKTGKVWFDENEDLQLGGGSKGRPEIDRTDLRNILFDSLAPDTVKWDHRVSEVKALSPDTYEISFTSQPPVRTSLLIGADGAFSRVRPLIHSTQPAYTGVTMYDLQISPSNLTSSLKTLIGNGTCIVLSDGKGLFPQMNSGGRCRVYAAISAHAKISNEEPWPEAGQRRQWLIKLYEDWDERYKELIMAADEETAAPRRIYAFDPESKWDASGATGVTIIGDAAHVMAPSGEGVNLALADALDLGKALSNLFSKSESPSRKQIHDTLRDFEKTMMGRAHPEMEISERMLDKFYGPDGGAEAFTEMLKLMMQGAGPGQA